MLLFYKISLNDYFIKGCCLVGDGKVDLKSMDRGFESHQL